MAHLSENSHPLIVKHVSIQSLEALLAASGSITDVYIIRLPAHRIASEYNCPINSIGEIVATFAAKIAPSATLIVIGEVIDLVQIQSKLPASLRYQHWIAIKRDTPRIFDKCHLPNQHFGALVYTRYKQSLRHTKTRVKYTYCPVCDKTTKDYGGKKHIYHEIGTLLSDVWRDISCDLEGDISAIVERFGDLFGLEPYRELTVFDCRPIALQRLEPKKIYFDLEENRLPEKFINRILNVDCLEELRRMPDNSIDFIFSDPPYNLGKKYVGYTDDLHIKDYFRWCDEWIGELARILKPGCTLAILNIPLWAVRHFLYMQTILKYQNWIIWDALAFPVRLIMPAHYTIICFSKGDSRELPGLTVTSNKYRMINTPKSFNALKPLADRYCLRESCLDTRISALINDRASLTDVWGDIHRLKHNSRRVDHPCQLPPHLMYRLISIFTRSDETILDCFNGAGTTTLTAHQLDRKYIGIESSGNYCSIANKRHLEIENGLDPFRKEERILNCKNSRVPRLHKQVYKIPKKTLQLEVKRVAKQIGHIPSRDELINYCQYPIEYYDKYFISWGEVTAAARTTGMAERRAVKNSDSKQSVEQLCLIEIKSSKIEK